MERIASGGRIGTLRSDVEVVALVSMARAWVEWLVVAYQSSRSPIRSEMSRQSSASSDAAEDQLDLAGGEHGGGVLVAVAGADLGEGLEDRDDR